MTAPSPSVKRSSARRTPKPRTASFVAVNPVYGTLELTIGDGPSAEVVGYHVEVLPHDLGPTFRCFQVTKYASQQDPAADEPSDYAVAVDVEPADPERPQHICPCRGFSRWGHCRHTSALASLIRAGKL